MLAAAIILLPHALRAADAPAKAAAPAAQGRPADADTPAARIVAAAQLQPQFQVFATEFVRGWQIGFGSPAVAPQIRERLKTTIQRIVDQELAAERMTGAVAMALAARSAAEHAAMLGWWTSPLGSQVATIDSTQFTPALQVEFARFVGDLQVKPLPAERVQRMTDLVAAVGVGALAKDVAEQSMQGMITALRAAGVERSPAGAQGLNELETQLRPLLDVLAVRVEQTTRLRLLFVYRDISDADLDRYLEFARSEAGKAYTAALASTTTAAVTRVVKEVAEQLSAQSETTAKT
jgi:hypothetical protein